MTFDWFVFPFHRFHSVTTLTVLKPVLCFHKTSFSYGAFWVRDVDPTCRCHQSNVIPNSIFSVNIAHCLTCGFCCCCCVHVFSWRKGAPFFHYYISRFWETYNGLRQRRLISLKWGFLFGAFPVDFKQRISFGGSMVVYIATWLGMLSFQSIQPSR